MSTYMTTTVDLKPFQEFLNSPKTKQPIDKEAISRSAENYNTLGEKESAATEKIKALEFPLDEVIVQKTAISDQQSSATLIGRIKQFFCAIPKFLKKIIDYVKSWFLPSSVEEPKKAVRFNEARVREFDPVRPPSNVGEIHSTTFEKLD